MKGRGGHISNSPQYPTGNFYGTVHKPPPVALIDINYVPVGATGNLVFNEIPTGAANGTNALFTTLNNFVPESVEAFINGYKLTLLTDYNTNGNNQIQLTVSPSTGEVITVNYIKI